jgi:hypothetical protein
VEFGHCKLNHTQHCNVGALIMKCIARRLSGCTLCPVHHVSSSSLASCAQCCSKCGGKAIESMMQHQKFQRERGI